MPKLSLPKPEHQPDSATPSCGPTAGQGKLTLYGNPFNYTRDVRRFDLVPGESLGEALKRENVGDDFVFTCNGEVLPPDRALAYTPLPADELAIVPVLHNPVLKMIASVAVAAIATYVSAGIASPLLAAAVGAAITIGGNLLIAAVSLLFQKKPPGSNYGVLGPSTTARSGIPIPKGFGTMRSAGNVIESWIDIMGNNEDDHDVDDGADQIGRQYINCRIDFGFGPGLSFENLWLNGKDISNYADVAYAVLYGTNDQAPVTVDDSRWVILNRTTTGSTTNNNPTTGFDTVNNNYPQNQRVRCGIPQNFVVVPGQRDDTDELTVYVSFPQGVWRYDDNMIIKRCSISYYVFYRTAATATAASGEWILADNHYYTNIRQTLLRQATIVTGLAPGRYDVMVQKIGSGAFGNPLDYFEHESNQWGDEVWVESVQETSHTTLSYPNMIQLCLRFMATDQLSGSDVNVTMDWTYGLRSTLPAELSQYASEAPCYGSDVPACVAYDILSDDLVGANLPDSRIDLDFLANWAALSESQVDNGDGGTQTLAKFNGVFEQDNLNIWAALNTVAAMSSANLQRIGALVTGWLDLPDVPVQMFHVGNILKDSYSKTYLNLEDRAQEIEVTFADIADNYKTRNPVRVIFDVDETSDQALKKTQVNLLGCTNQVQAYYWGALKLNESETLIRSHSWRSNAEAIRCRTGNVVLLQHDVPQWGWGGRLQPGSTATKLILDRTDLAFNTETGSLFTIIVVHPALERAAVTILSVAGNAISIAYPVALASPLQRLLQGSLDTAILSATPQDSAVVSGGPPPTLVGYSLTVEDGSGFVAGAAALWDLDVMETRTVTALAGEVATISEALSAVPAEYAGYVYQSISQLAIPVRIRSIKKEIGKQRYTIQAIDYADSTYTIPPPVAGTSYVPPLGSTGGTGSGDDTTAVITVQYAVVEPSGSDFTPPSPSGAYSGAAEFRAAAEIIPPKPARRRKPKAGTVAAIQADTPIIPPVPPPPGTGGGPDETYTLIGTTILAPGLGYSSTSTFWIISDALNSSGGAADTPQQLTITYDGTGAITALSATNNSQVWAGRPYGVLTK